MISKPLYEIVLLFILFKGTHFIKAEPLNLSVKMKVTCTTILHVVRVLFVHVYCKNISAEFLI